MLRNKEASCPPSLFLVFSLSLHLSLFSSVDIPQRQASKPSAFPSLYLLFSSVRDIDCFRPTHTRIFFPSKQLPSLSKLVFALRVSSIRLATRESFDKKRKKKQSSAMVHGNAYKKLGRVVDGRIRKDWPTQHPFGPPRSAWSQTKGLETTGLQCWRNAMLQCLLHVPEFFHYLSRAERCEERSCQGPKRTGVPCVYCALRELALHYWTSTSTSFRVKKLRAFQTAMQLHPARNPGDVQGLSTRFWTRPGCTTPMSSSLV
jgi:hypothetical protein